MGRKRAPGYARPCRRGLHTIPAGKLCCVPCKNESKAQRLRGGPDARPEPAGGVAAYLRAAHIPILEILAQAACSPELAYLFDVGAPKAQKAAEEHRHAAARSVCAGCPVREACYADAYAGRQLGVYGGVVMDQGFWSVEGRQGIVQDVQSVQDYPA